MKPNFDNEEEAGIFLAKLKLSDGTTVRGLSRIEVMYTLNHLKREGYVRLSDISRLELEWQDASKEARITWTSGSVQALVTKRAVEKAQEYIDTLRKELNNERG